MKKSSKPKTKYDVLNFPIFHFTITNHPLFHHSIIPLFQIQIKISSSHHLFKIRPENNLPRPSHEGNIKMFVKSEK